MSEYEGIRARKLILKGEKGIKRKKKQRDKKKEIRGSKIDSDAILHGHWWRVKSMDDVKGAIAIEIGKNSYVKALDNGLFALGAPHDEGDGPSPEEILTAVPINEQKVALKSGYGKYLSVNKNGIVIGRSDAIGPKEYWEPVFQEDKMAISSYTDCFLSADLKDDSIIANSKKAGVEEMVVIRSQTVVEVNPLKDVPTEEHGSLEQIEVNYVKKFQKFQDKRLRICPEDKNVLEGAKVSGILHETLLDRRSKMKSDRYCK